MRAALRSAVEQVAGDLGGIVGALPGTATRVITQNFIGDCTLESGYELADGFTEKSTRCATSEYHSQGLIAHFDFPLSSYLTCIKNQGQRGTCTAHAIVAAVETQARLGGAGAENLSEQQAYFTAKVADWANRYDDGLGLEDTLDGFVRNGYRFQYESNWNYNPAWNRADHANETTHKLRHSCDNYEGEMCTNYVFQARQISAGSGAYTYEYPAPAASGRRITEYAALPLYSGALDVSLALAAVFTAGKVPVLMCFGVSAAFSGMSGDGYVEYDSGAEVIGSHCVLAVGFIPNDLIPAGLPPAAEQGYFIVKNSWGSVQGDCGFAYLSYKYLRRRVSEMAYLRALS